MVKYPSIKDQKFGSKKEKWHAIIFGAESQEGRRFDIWLLWAILLSVLAVMAETVSSFNNEYGHLLTIAEYFFTILFTAEYALRIAISKNPRKYIFSFWGIIDLLSILPTFIGFFVSNVEVLRILRIVRLLRIFRVLRLTSFLSEAQSLGVALKRSSAKIIVFFGTVLILVIVMGTVMYLIEPSYVDGKEAFSNIPRSIYWAIVTLTTVGYGDVVPTTAVGQFLSSALMILGYAVIAVPTGIVSVQMNKTSQMVVCNVCDNGNNDNDAKYCKKCGEKLLRT